MAKEQESSEGKLWELNLYCWETGPGEGMPASTVQVTTQRKEGGGEVSLGGSKALDNSWEARRKAWTSETLTARGRRGKRVACFRGTKAGMLKYIVMGKSDDFLVPPLHHEQKSYRVHCFHRVFSRCVSQPLRRQ